MYAFLRFQSLQNESGYHKLTIIKNKLKIIFFHSGENRYLLTAVTREKQLYKLQQLKNSLSGMLSPKEPDFLILEIIQNSIIIHTKVQVYSKLS